MERHTYDDTYMHQSDTDVSKSISVSRKTVAQGTRVPLLLLHNEGLHTENATSDSCERSKCEEDGSGLRR